MKIKTTYLKAGGCPGGWGLGDQPQLSGWCEFPGGAGTGCADGPGSSCEPHGAEREGRGVLQRSVAWAALMTSSCW